MKVKIQFTVDIDVEAWCEAYGTTRAEVRDDVRLYVEHGAVAQLRDLGLLLDMPSPRRTS